MAACQALVGLLYLHWTSWVSGRAGLCVGPGSLRVRLTPKELLAGAVCRPRSPRLGSKTFLAAYLHVPTPLCPGISGLCSLRQQPPAALPVRRDRGASRQAAQQPPGKAWPTLPGPAGFNQGCLGGEGGQQLEERDPRKQGEQCPCKQGPGSVGLNALRDSRRYWIY